jgi:pyruvate/2-oxoglutarate dehydrogenase complex dihydrolipoamide acyltransferase (E2) component
MPTPITMPRLGESVSEGTIGRWLKQEGDTIRKDESIVEIITDKVTAELPAPVSGRIVRIIAKDDETVKVGDVIAEVEESGGSAVSAGAATSSAVSAGSSGSTMAAPVALPAPAPAASALGPSANGGSYASAAPTYGGTAIATEQRLDRVSPLARRMAQEHAIDLSQVRGTGENGRIRKEDIEAHLAQRIAQPAMAVAPAAPPALPAMAPVASAPAVSPITAPVTPPTLGAEDEVITPPPARRMIAEHMVRSKQASPHAYTSVEVDMSHVARWLDRHKEDFRKREGYGVSFQTFVIKAAAEALKEHPYLNASWTEDGKIVLRKQVNVGISIALENNLMVPVIRNADVLNLTGIARAVSDLVARARTNKLMPADLQGATFTVNNPGVFGTVLSMAIINQPNAAILTMDAVVKRPVVVGDAIAIREMMFLSLSFDHRVMDGLQAARFLGDVKQRLEAVSDETTTY